MIKTLIMWYNLVIFTFLLIFSKFISRKLRRIRWINKILCISAVNLYLTIIFRVKNKTRLTALNDIYYSGQLWNKI